MKLNKFKHIINNISPEVKAHVEFSMNVLDRINFLLDWKLDGKQKTLADKMGKSEAEVSKWFSGVQNFTTKTLIRLEVAFGEPIIAVCTNDESDCTYVLANIPYTGCSTSLEITVHSEIKEIVEYREAAIEKAANHSNSEIDIA